MPDGAAPLDVVLRRERLQDLSEIMTKVARVKW
jgi:hypothetical protein